MATPCGGGRRRRLMAGALGRSLDEAYRHPQIRADLEAEAASGDPEALVTPAMLDDLRDLMAEKQALALRAESEPSAARLFFSTEAVVLVPGFLASALGDAAERGLGLIWVDPTVVLSDQV